MKCKVEIKETLSRIVDIEAESKQDAITNVKMAYNDERIVLGSEDYVNTEITVVES